MCWRWGQHLFLAIDKVGGVHGSNLKAVPVGDGVGGAGFHAVSAKDAAVVIDVVNLSVALGAAYAVLFGIVGGLNINAIRRTGGGAEEASHTLFQTILIALQNVDPAKALLKLRALERTFAIGIVL